MEHYSTRRYFTKSFDNPDLIDPWLKSFEDRSKPAGSGNHAEIEGYAVLGDKIVITVSRWGYYE